MSQDDPTRGVHARHDRSMCLRRIAVIAAFLVSGLSAASGAQVRTTVPDPVPGAKAVTVERIKIHGAALESNLEGDAVDRALPTGPNQQAVLAKWAANAPLAFIDQNVGGLRQYRAIAIDVGDMDNLKVDAGKLHDILDSYHIANIFEIYSGTHTSNVAVRFQDFVIPFFGRTLVFR